jgi:hypothetical protein
MCGEVARKLPSILDSRNDAPLYLVSHIETCLVCQAELARYKKLLRLLGQLSREHAELPEGALSNLLGSLGGVARRHAIRSLLSGKRLAYLGGIFCCVVATTGIVVLARARPRGLSELERRVKGSIGSQAH